MTDLNVAYLRSDRSIFILDGDLYVAKSTSNGVDIIRDITTTYHIKQSVELYGLSDRFREIYIQHSCKLDIIYRMKTQSSEKIKFYVKSGSKGAEILCSIYITIGEAVNIIKEHLKICN